jgi:hypothetical protein
MSLHNLTSIFDQPNVLVGPNGLIIVGYDILLSMIFYVHFICSCLWAGLLICKLIIFDMKHINTNPNVESR